MGRWVTSKGRRIYIPDKGEENPYAKKETKLNDAGKGKRIPPYTEQSNKLKNQINKDLHTKEKQIA